MLKEVNPESLLAGETVGPLRLLHARVEHLLEETSVGQWDVEYVCVDCLKSFLIAVPVEKTTCVVAELVFATVPDGRLVFVENYDHFLYVAPATNFGCIVVVVARNVHDIALVQYLVAEFDLDDRIVDAAYHLRSRTVLA